MKVLFLDIDGVVLSGQELWRTRNNRYLPPEKIALVKEVCDRTGAVIVVSSTWRMSDDTEAQLRDAGLPLHDDWRTPFNREMRGSLYIADRRGGEIEQWLEQHPEGGAYAIVDDDDDMLGRQIDSFVQTPFETGIDREHVERLVAILKTSPNHQAGGREPTAE